MTLGKAEKRARKKQGRRDRIEAETKAAEQRRKRNLNYVLAVITLVAVAFLAYHFTLGKPAKKVNTTASPAVTATVTATATPTATTTPSAAASAAATSTVTCDLTKPPTAGTVSQPTPPPMTIDKTKTYTATMVTSCGTIVMALDAKDSPNTVNDFVYLANKGFYNGLTFHRIVKDFAIQGGDPKGDGTGGPGYEVTDPIPSGTVYSLGTVAMANAGTTGGAGSQFFIVPSASAASGFSPLYAILGHVTSGLDVVDKLNNWPTQAGASGEKSSPIRPVYIKTVTIQTS